jgi:hypothetical protein
MNCWFQMPYANGARLTVTNDSPYDSFLYFYVDYQEWPACPPDLGRFHACWQRRLVRRAPETRGPMPMAVKTCSIQRNDIMSYWILTARASMWGAAAHRHQ